MNAEQTINELPHYVFWMVLSAFCLGYLLGDFINNIGKNRP